jgi:predicted outer membrane protein
MARREVRCSDNQPHNFETIMRASLLLAAPLILTTSAFAQDAPPSQGQPISSGGKDFLGFASQVNVSEIGGGLVAEQKAQAPAVKAFGRLMTLDHSELQSQLDAIAAADNVALPDQHHRHPLS